MSRSATLAGLLLVILGCGSSGEQTSVKTEWDYLAEPPYVDADLSSGEMLSLACRVCHTLEVGEEHRTGPNLHGVFGRQAGTLAGFRFSEAMRQFGAVWTPDVLDRWLADPAAFVPNSSMVFVGLHEETDRRDLIAYLLRETAKAIE